ncbi:MAG: redoxin family protein [Lachnospiraceae bacterium]|nr:redoxin family protein [Lachnospiraceae bacterium]
MKKKILALILGTILLSMTACGSSSGNASGNGSESQAKEETTENEEAQMTEGAKAADKSTEAVEEEIALNTESSEEQEPGGESGTLDAFNVGGEQENPESDSDMTTEKSGDEQNSDDSEGRLEEETSTAATEAAEGQAVEAEAAEAVATGPNLLFTTVDLDGNYVDTADIFSQNKVTMVNLWATWCGPCVGELPYLAEINESLSKKGCGIVGICMDVSDGGVLYPEVVEEAKEILSYSNVTYTNLALPDGYQDTVMNVNSIPTSFFVDSKGVIIGEPIIGAQVEVYEPYIDELLKGM